MKLMGVNVDTSVNINTILLLVLIGMISYILFRDEIEMFSADESKKVVSLVKKYTGKIMKGIDARLNEDDKKYKELMERLDKAFKNVDKAFKNVDEKHKRLESNIRNAFSNVKENIDSVSAKLSQQKETALKRIETGKLATKSLVKNFI